MYTISKYSIKQIKTSGKEIHVDCSNAVLGRLLSFIASLSRSVDIDKIYLHNIGKIMIKSNLEYIVNRYRNKINLGLEKGPFIHKSQPKLLKRMLRNMYKKGKKDTQNFEKVITWGKDDNQYNINFEKKPCKIYIYLERLVSSLNPI
jgi:ribosomal protein L13